MRGNIGETESEGRDQIREATEGLLAQLIEHHNFDVPCQFITKRQVVKIIEEHPPETEVEVCILPIPEGRITVSGIKHVVSRHFGISHSDLISERRDHKVLRPRMVAIYLSKLFTTHSLPALGKFFGGRDHTTILHAVRRMEGLIVSNDPLSRDALYLKEVLSA